MVIFHSYVSLPEGIYSNTQVGNCWRDPLEKGVVLQNPRSALSVFVDQIPINSDQTNM